MTAIKKKLLLLMYALLLAGIAYSNYSRPGFQSASTSSLHSVEKENTHGYVANIPTFPHSEENKGMEMAEPAPYQQSGEQELQLTNRFLHLVYTFGKMVMVI